MTTYLLLEKRAGNVQGNGSLLFSWSFFNRFVLQFCSSHDLFRSYQCKVCSFNSWARFKTICIARRKLYFFLSILYICISYVIKTRSKVVQSANWSVTIANQSQLLSVLFISWLKSAHRLHPLLGSSLKDCFPYLPLRVSSLDSRLSTTPFHCWGSWCGHSVMLAIPLKISQP